jgi:hypothetical protein
MFYQYDESRLSTCPLTIHALLHIADGIDAAGPVWCYWSFAMERFCGAITRGNKNRANPYTSLDRRVRDVAQLQMVKVKFGLLETLSLRQPKGELDEDADTFDGCVYRFIFFTRLDIAKIYPKMTGTLYFHRKRGFRLMDPSNQCWRLPSSPATVPTTPGSRSRSPRRRYVSQGSFNNGAKFR